MSLVKVSTVIPMFVEPLVEPTINPAGPAARPLSTVPSLKLINALSVLSRLNVA